MNDGKTPSRAGNGFGTALRGFVTVAALFGPLGCADQVTPAPHPIADAPEDPAADAFEAAANRPPTVRTVYVMSKLYVVQGKDIEAENLLRQVIKETPKFVPAYCDLAELQLRRQRVEDAKQTLAAGLKVAPGDAVLSNDLGMCYLRTGEYELALTSFQSAYKAKPEEPRYRTNAALATAMLGRYEDALALYKQVLPEADAHYNLGVICESIQDHSRASQEFQKAIELGNNKQRAAAAAQSKALGMLAEKAVRVEPRPPARLGSTATVSTPQPASTASSKTSSSGASSSASAAGGD
jgi:tetratricopeptide (TPR) repeat protein